jgi:hypothetical protein
MTSGNSAELTYETYAHPIGSEAISANQHTMGDWLKLHHLDANRVLEIISAFKAGKLPAIPAFLSERASELLSENAVSPNHELKFTFEEAKQKYVFTSFSSYFGTTLRIDGFKLFFDNLKFELLAEPPASFRPFTSDLGKDQNTKITLCWTGSVADVVCLAHEVAHALQTSLSNHEFMVPLARETSAFFGELILLEWIAKHDPENFNSFLSVWEIENHKYLGEYAYVLASAVKNGDSAYKYELNYPIARMKAVEFFEAKSMLEMVEFFKSGHQAVHQLFIKTCSPNNLDVFAFMPPYIVGKDEKLEIDLYRELGMMALLDIRHQTSASKIALGNYHVKQLSHLLQQTAFIGMKRNQKPAGYVTWVQNGDLGDAILITQKTVSKDDQPALQRALSSRLEGHEIDWANVDFNSSSIDKL